MRFFFSSLSPPLSLSLCWVCATSVGSVVMFLCSEWIHQHKNVLIIFIFYYTTWKPCQLGCRTLGRKREREQKGRRASEKERGRNERWGGNGMMQITSKTEKSMAKDRQVNKERGKQSEEEWRWRANEIGGKAQVRQRSGKRGVEKAPWNSDNMITLLKGKHRNGLMKRHSYTHTHPYRLAIQNQRPLVSGDEGMTEAHGFERKQRGPVIERKGR